MLHVVNKSHMQTSALKSCLRLAQDGQALLLTEDAVYAATAQGAASAGLESALARLKVYALAPDLQARGMDGKLAPGVTALDYASFVDLVCEHSVNQSWL